MTLLLVFSPGAAALVALLGFCIRDRWKHRRDDDYGLTILHPWPYIAPSPRLSRLESEPWTR